MHFFIFFSDVFKMAADGTRIAQNHLKRLHPVVNNENIDICLQAASAFADGKLTEINVQKAAGAAGLAVEQLKAAVVLLLELHVILSYQKSLAALLSHSDLLESIIEWSEMERERLIIEREDGDRRMRKGALIRCDGRIDFEIAHRTAAVVPPQPSALLQLRVGGEARDIRLRLEKPMINRLVDQLEEAIRACNK